jgi:hypothetical protein
MVGKLRAAHGTREVDTDADTHLGIVDLAARTRARTMAKASLSLTRAVYHHRSDHFERRERERDIVVHIYCCHCIFLLCANIVIIARWEVMTVMGNRPDYLLHV